ncbi:VWA domain-containing protein [Pirellulales bacterium]|nr:VWA domain-containing protein [Pirellulales bacterium]
MFEIVSLQPLVWLLAIVAMAFGLRYSLVDRPSALRRASWGFRATAIALLVLALCRPFAADQSDELHVNLLVDVSQSVDLKQAIEQLNQIDEWIDNLRRGDSWSLYAVANDVRQFESVGALRTTLRQWAEGMADDEFRSGSRLADALLETRLSFPAGKARRAVLISDGHDTTERIELVLKQLAEEGVDVRLREAAGLDRAEAAVAAIRPASPQAFFGEVMRLEVESAANRAMSARLRIIHKGVAVAEQVIKLDSEQSTLSHFDVDLTTPGASQWTAELLPDDDYFPVNNQATCMIQVHGRPRILMLHDNPQQLRPFSKAMREQKMEIEIRGEHGLPDSLAGLAAFDAIVLSNMPATSLSPRQMQMLKQYVVDLGAGLAMLGSENSFGLGGYYKTPVEEVLPLISRFEKEKEKPSLAMVLVIDKSGSMQGLPIELARQAAKAAAELLSPRDSIGVVGFDGQATVICEMTGAGDVDGVHAAIDSLQAGGGTYMYPGMVTGKEMLESTPAKIRHMICLSDGHTQPADHQSLAEEMADAGVTVSTVALGQADKQLLAQIAEVGRGRYYETDDPGNVPQIFTKETMQAAKSAIKEDLYAAVQTADHAILAGYQDADLPFTLGYVMTEAKPTAQLLLAVETGDPLLAVGRYGLGVGLAYTSDLTETWGGRMAELGRVRQVLGPGFSRHPAARLSRWNGSRGARKYRRQAAEHMATRCPSHCPRWRASRRHPLGRLPVI